MKEKRITQKIIDLATAIAKLWRAEIKRGTWIIDDNGKEALITRIYNDGKVMADYGNYTRYFTKDNPKIFPIPDSDDCEQKLIELGYESMNLLRRPLQNPWMANVWDAESHNLDANMIKRWEDKGKTLHEALLSTLLEVLKNE